MSEGKKNTNTALFIGLGAVLAVAAAVVVAQRLMAREGGPASPPRPTPGAAASQRPGLVSDAEREGYIARHVVIEGLTVDPDTQIGPEGTSVTIPGQLRVHGAVKNTGDKAIDRLIMVLNPLDGAGAVIGSYREDIAQNRRLEPNEERAFAFRIPDKKEFSGEYQHRVE